MENDSQPPVTEAMVNAVRDALPEGVVADEWLAEVVAAVLRVTVEQCLPERKKEASCLRWTTRRSLPSEKSAGSYFLRQ
jgi:hypothetical protein